MRTRPGVVSRAVVAVSAVALGSVARSQIPGENVNMVSGTHWPGGDPYLQRQNEPTLAVSSVNPRHLVASANDYRSVDVPDPAAGAAIIGDAWIGLFKSLDGGQTWKSVLLPGYPQECSAIAMENARRASAVPPQPALPVNPLCGYPAAADPVVRAGTDGLFYLAGLNFLRDKSGSRIFVARFIDDNNKENGSATGDPALRDPANPTRFTPTDPIRYVDTVEVWSSERNRAAWPTAPTMFMDKPWIAVDVPRTGASCPITTASGAQILAGTVHVAWTQFYPDDYQSDVMLSSSSDCGATWSRPLKLNRGNSAANVGATVAVEPITGRVYVAWRRAPWPAVGPRQGDAIMATRSEGRKREFASPRTVAKIIPFDMASGWGRARTMTMPTLALSTDGTNSWAHVAWAARAVPGGDASIYHSTARVHPRPAGDDDEDEPEEYDDETRLVWSTPAIADRAPVTDDAGNTFTRGHQYMPALTFGQGRLMLLYYDTRLDHSVRFYRPVPPAGGRFYEEELAPRGELADGDWGAVFGPEVDDAALAKVRHTVDVRVASLPWGGAAVAGGALVSRFPLGIRGDETNPDHLAVPPALPIAVPGFGSGGSIVPGKLGLVDGTGLLLREQQLQVNAPGFPMFKSGSAAFIGDYVDIQGPSFVPRPGGWWAFATAPSGSPVFHAVWTSNQDVKTPWDGDWTRYTPVTALLGSALLYDGGRAGAAQTPVLACEPGSAGSRDQNVYTSRITEGLEVYSPQNVKPLAAGAPVGFVVAARNATPAPMSVLIAASSASPVTVPPPASMAVEYSFTRSFATPVTSVCTAIAPHSSVARTLFAQLTGLALASAPLYVRVDEVASCAPGAARLARSGFLTLNPPVALTSLVQPDGAALPPLANGEVYAVVTAAPSLSNPNPAPSLSNPSLSNPSLSNPSLSNPSLSNPSLSNPSLSNPSLSNPSLSNPSLSNPSLSNPSLSNPSLSNPSLSNPSLLNSTPWDATTTITNIGNTTTTYHVKVVGSGVDPAKPLQLVLAKTYFTPTAVGCDLKQVPHDEVIVSVPDIQDSIVSPTTQVDPGAADGSISNATIALAPAESATVTLRGYMALADMARTVGKVQVAAVPAAVVPQPNVTYENYAAATGQPPLVKPTPTVAVSYDTRTARIFAAVVANPSWPNPPPQPFTGTLTFAAGGQLGRVVTLDNGRAQIVWEQEATTTITALYSGDESYAPAAGSVTVPEWTPTGSLAAGRWGHTATLLPSGLVLVAGGVGHATPTSGIGVLASAEVYDPSTGTWTPTGSMITTRVGHTATLLPSGKVLVAGGEAAGVTGVGSTSAELYDPAAGSWTATGPLNMGREQHTATLLPSGRVLVTGGYVSFVTYTPTAEIYDPASGTWTYTGNMTEARGVHGAVLLPTGLVLVAGGFSFTSQVDALASAELYDPATGAWSATGAMSVPRQLHTLTPLLSGKVLAAGGYGDGTTQGTAELYDPSSGTWTPTGSLGTSRRQHVATLLPSGQVLVTGGWYFVSDAELYDPLLEAWTYAGGTWDRLDHTATLLQDGRVLVVGGTGTVGIVREEIMK